MLGGLVPLDLCTGCVTVPGTLCVWRFSLAVPARVCALYEQLLDGDELARRLAFRHPQRRQEFVVARGSLRRLLANRLGTDAAALRFATGAHGKPCLVAGCSDTDCHFNLSHSNGQALLGLWNGAEIGIDIQYHRPSTDCGRLAQRFFTRAEAALLAGLAPARQQAGFYRLWVRKEAVLKCLGQGLGYGLRRIDVGQSLDRRGCFQVDTEAGPVTLLDLDTHTAYSAAVAVRGALQHDPPAIQQLAWEHGCRRCFVLS